MCLCIACLPGCPREAEAGQIVGFQHGLFTTIIRHAYLDTRRERQRSRDTTKIDRQLGRKRIQTDSVFLVKLTESPGGSSR